MTFVNLNAVYACLLIVQHDMRGYGCRRDIKEDTFLLLSKVDTALIQTPARSQYSCS